MSEKHHNEILEELGSIRGEMRARFNHIDEEIGELKNRTSDNKKDILGLQETHAVTGALQSERQENAHQKKQRIDSYKDHAIKISIALAFGMIILIIARVITADDIASLL